jgi:phytoene dehydrogenase-like protein
MARRASTNRSAAPSDVRLWPSPHTRENLYLYGSGMDPGGGVTAIPRHDESSGLLGALIGSARHCRHGPTAKKFQLQ